MVKREAVANMPSSIRDGINQHLKTCIERAEAVRQEASFTYAMTNDEKQRANALLAAGELQAYTTLYNIFK